jgi:hypothetical protein
LIITGSISRALIAIEAAENNAIQGLEQGLIETEPSFTDRLLGGMEVAFSAGNKGLRADRFDLKLRTLRDRGANAPEREFGADLVCVFDSNIKGCILSKGLLVQAKKAGSGGVTISPGNHRYPEICVAISKRDPSCPNSLFAQCQAMLSITADSFVFVYCSDGIFVVPAISIVSLEVGGRPLNIYAKRLRYFMMDFMQCFLGDALISAVDDDSLRKARERVRARSAMMLTIQDNGQQPH